MRTSNRQDDGTHQIKLEVRDDYLLEELTRFEDILGFFWIFKRPRQMTRAELRDTISSSRSYLKSTGKIVQDYFERFNEGIEEPMLLVPEVDGEDVLTEDDWAEWKESHDQWLAESGKLTQKYRGLRVYDSWALYYRFAIRELRRRKIRELEKRAHGLRKANARSY